MGQIQSNTERLSISRGTSRGMVAREADLEAAGRPGCLVGGATRLYTREGIPAVSAAPGQVDVWTSVGWVPATVKETPQPVPLICITYSDGSTLECADRSLLPVVPPGDSPSASPVKGPSLSLESCAVMPPPEMNTDRVPSTNPVSRTSSINEFKVARGVRRRLKTTWSPRAATAAKPDDRITPPPRIPPADVKPVAGVDAARAAGADIGARISPAGVVLPEGVGDGARRYGADAARAFIDGWASAQQGCLIGCRIAVADLQMVLRRIGITKTIIERGGFRDTIAVDEKEAWPAPPDAVRRWTRRIRTAHQKVVSVEATGRSEKMYSVVLHCDGPVAVAVNNTMIACALQNESQ